MGVNIKYFTDRDEPITGIIHVGTHGGDEIDLYKELGIDKVIGFEPIPEWQKIANKKYGGNCHRIALSDREGVSDFYVTKDGAFGQCSSLYEPINMVGGRIDGVAEVIRVATRRFDNWAFGNLFPPDKLSQYNALVIDTQGSEFEVLKGFGKYLDEIDFLICEMSAEPLYKGGTPAQKISDWLSKKGFTRLTPIHEHDDVAFIRSSQL